MSNCLHIYDIWTTTTWWKLKSDEGVLPNPPSAVLMLPGQLMEKKMGYSPLLSDTSRMMEIHKDSGSAFNLNFHHLPCWKENHRRKECVCVCVRACVCPCACDTPCMRSVSVLILKVAPLSRDLSNADVHRSTSHNHPPQPLP